MNNLKAHFPKQLLKIIDNLEYEKNSIGCTNTHVFFIRNFSEANNAYLKINPVTNFEKMEHEKEIIKWLEGKIPVPKIYYFDKNEKFEFMLMSEIIGHPSFREKSGNDGYARISELARGLKSIHNIDISECPFDERIEKKFKIIKDKIVNNEIDTNDWEEENQDKSIEELYEKLKDMRRMIKEDLVFTHGDYCMPNIIINENKLSGFIDLGRAGISDKYQDIALMTRSMKFNGFKKKHIKYFLKEYGIEKLDNMKIEFYKLVDEFY